MMYLLFVVAPQLFYIYDDTKPVSSDVFMVISLIGFVVFIPALIFYLLTLQNTLKAIAPENRAMRPGQVWLLLIPVFGLVWHFIIVNNMATSIEQEYKSKGIILAGRPAYSVGITMCILFCCSSLFLFFMILRFITIIAAVVRWIVYWVRINNYKNKMLQFQQLPVAAPATGRSKYFTT
jgi:hypothetical protein